MDRSIIQPENHLLGGLPADEWNRLAPLVEKVTLPCGRTLTNADGGYPKIYFPVSCDVSLLVMLPDGAMPEVAAVGREGMVGVSAFMGCSDTSVVAQVRTGGQAYCMSATALRREFERGGPMHDALLRYTHALMTQIVQVAICNGRHSLQQRLGRWLLSSLDCRHASSEISMTQDRIASLLGVRREGVTVAAGAFQRAGIIRYSRGSIKVLDRAKLEREVCDCYRIVKSEFDHLRPDAIARDDCRPRAAGSNYNYAESRAALSGS